MTTVKAFASMEAGKEFEAYEYDLPEIGRQEIEIEVESCGICHSDLSMDDINSAFERVEQAPALRVVLTR